MSDTIDGLIADIMTQRDKGAGVIETIIEEEPEKKEEEPKPIPHGSKGKKSKRKGTGIKGGAPTVGSKGGPGVRCYMRYRNNGTVFRICSGPPPPTTKPPAVFTPMISPEEFIRKLTKSNKRIKSYGDLSDNQKREYHRLAQGNSRARRRENSEMNNDQYTLFLEQKRMDAQIDRVEDRLQRKREKEEKRVKRNMEERGILANNPEDIKKYFKMKTEKEIKSLKSDKFKEEFFESKKDDAEDRFKEALKEDDDIKIGRFIDIVDNEKKLTKYRTFKKNEKGEMVKGPFEKGLYETKTFKFPGAEGSYTIEDMVKDFGFDRKVMLYQLGNNPNLQEDLNKIGKGLINKKIIQANKGKPLNEDQLSALLNKNRKRLPLYEMSDKTEKKIIDLYEDKMKERKDKAIKKIEEQYKERLEKREKDIREINDTKQTKMNYKYKQAVKDAREKGKSYQWVKKNVRLIFDKDLSGKAKVGDIGDLLMGVDDALESIEDIDEELQELQAGQKKARKKRQKKKKELTAEQKAKELAKEQKEMDRLQRQLNKIRNKY